MNYQTLFIAFAILFAVANARVYFQIDTFETSQDPLILIVPQSDPEYGWWAPYEGSTGPPEADFHDTTDCVSGQRDVILGYEGVTPRGSVAIISLVNNRASVALPLNYIGGAYFQWDGDDNTGGSNVFPGVLLNTSPGIGSGISTTMPESDGTHIDFTSFGRAFGIGITVSADLDVDYFLDVIDGNDAENELTFVHIPPGQGDTNIRYFFPYNSNEWITTPTGANFDWTNVAAFQVRIFTFNGQAGPSIDTDFFSLGVFGYEITGSVFIDCLCDGSPESFVNGERFNLHSGSSSSGALIDTVLSDANGDFSFFPTVDGTYTVCLDDPTQERCSLQIPNGCRTVVLQNRQDPTTILFPLTTVSTLTPPPDVTVECGSCTTTTCLGMAVSTNCGGGPPSTVNTFTDARSGTCTVTILRTFTDQGQSVTQTITIIDSFAPTLLAPATPVTRTCTDSTGQTYSAWLAADGNSDFDDCNNFSVFNNAGSQQPGNCGSVTVTFTASDVCSRTTATTATYTVTDLVAPTFSTPPSSQTANCDVSGGSDIAAYNTWISSNAGARATDNCSGATITNNNPGAPARGCNNAVTATFTATDNCGNTASRTASFTINDVNGPTFTTAATNPTVQCNSSSQSAFTTYLNNNGNAVAVDDCTASNLLTFSNDSTGSGPFGCDDSRTVTFTVSDTCGRTSETTGTFRVRDTTAPTLTQQAAPLSTNCETGGSNELNNWLNDNGGARATDACTDVTFTNDFGNISGDCTQVPVTFTGCDACNNACVVSTATYSIIDTQPPTFVTRPSPLTVECGSDTQTAYDSWLATDGGATISDNCATQNELTLTNNAPATAPVGSGCTAFVDVNFFASDPCGNIAPVQSARFTVTDSVGPTFTSFVLDQTVECAPSSNTQAYNQWRSSRGGAVAVDSCSTVTYTNNGPSSVGIAAGQCSSNNVVTFVASDVCGNTASDTGSFTIIDSTPPTVNPTASNAQAECSSSGVTTWLNNNGGARATDACSTVTFTNNFNGFTGGCTETAFVTFTATDACGFGTDTSATYSITDTTSPIINPRASARSVPCDANTGSALSAWINDNGGARASDACQDDADLTWTNNFAQAPVGCDFVTVTFTVTDSCGNTATTTSTFTSVDNDPPTFSPPAQNLTVECNGSGNTGDYSSFVSTRGGAVAIDQCAFQFTWTNNAPATGPTTCASRTVVFVVEDECGNSASTTATYTVADTQPPTFLTVAANRNVECDGTGNTSDKNSWISSNGGATASDVCGTTTFTQVRASTTGDSCSTTDIYTFTARDQCGNTASITAQYTIHDFSSPAITTEPADVTYECDGNGNIPQITSWVNDNAGARASDICQGAITWTNDFSGNGIFTCTSIQVGFTASDGCGNIVSRSATVTVEDSTMPIWSFFPEDITIPCDADASTDVLGFAESNDTCSGELFVSMSETEFDEPPNGDCPGDHIITRTFSAFDDCGNSITRDQVVTVVIARASGPCDPEGCECDDCCPPAAASDCLAVNCQAVACRSAPCEASLCSCTGTTGTTSKSLDREADFELPQCKPVYIYVNDDDDTVHDVDTTEIAKQRMFITNEPIHESFLRN